MALMVGVSGASDRYGCLDYRIVVVYICMYGCAHIWILVFSPVNIYSHLYVYEMYARMYLLVYVHMYACMHVCLFTFIHLWIGYKHFHLYMHA